MKKLLFIIQTLLITNLLLAQIVTNYTKENSSLASNNVKTINIDGNGIIWFATDNGLNNYNGKEWKTYNTDNNLTSNKINDIALDDNGEGLILWLATDDGVTKVSLNKEGFIKANTLKTNNSGLVSNKSFALSINQDHLKWFGTEQGVSLLKGDKWQIPKLTMQSFFRSNPIICMGSRLDTCYIGTQGAGVSRLISEPDGITSASPWDTDWSGLGSDTINAIFIDKYGSQWVATNFGVSYHNSIFTKQNWEMYTMEEGLIDNMVLSVAQDHKGNLWLGTANGLSFLEGNKFTNYNMSHGLIGNRINDIAIDSTNAIWLATDKGVSKVELKPVQVDPVGINIKSFKPYAFFNVSIQPNPYKSDGKIVVEIPSSENIVVEILDMSGKSVRTIFKGFHNKGIATLYWDCKTYNNSRVTNGFYILKVATAKKMTTQKIVIVN